jgi:hypothetical protein
VAIELERRFRVAVAGVRDRLRERDRQLFDLVCAAGQLGVQLPTDRYANVSVIAGASDPRRRLADEFPEAFSRSGPGRHWLASAARLSEVLCLELRARSRERDVDHLARLLGNASTTLAPDCRVPTHPALRAAWKTVLKVFARRYPSRVAPLGRLEWLDDTHLQRLSRETVNGRQTGRPASGRRPGAAGRALAIDPRLMARVGRALRRAVVPGYVARYVFYSKPGDYFWPHPDNPEYDLNILVCLDRDLPPRARRGSAFLAFRPDYSVERYELEPGCALAVEARGLVHGREPMRAGEHVTMLSIAARYA